MANRDYSDPAYKKFCKEVRERDGNCCILCKSKKRIQVHHLIRHADSEYLRTVTSNGCCVCYKCHRYKITGNELYYQELLKKLVRAKQK